MIAVIDSQAGNLRRIATALRRLGADFRITAQPEVALAADRLVFPGVGEARAAITEAVGRREAGRSGLARRIVVCLDVREGYELPLTRRISESVGIPVVASGGAGAPEHLARVFEQGLADAALVASLVHFGTCSVGEIKRYLASRGIPVRLEQEAV